MENYVKLKTLRQFGSLEVKNHAEPGHTNQLL